MILLDTQAALWWLTGSRRLGAEARRLMTVSDCLFSVASLWEVQIKHQIGKLELDAARVEKGMVEAGATILAITASHVGALAQLTTAYAALAALKDPFDRLLLASTRCEGAGLLTADSQLLHVGGRKVIDATK